MILVIGGTSEAKHLCRLLYQQGYCYIYSQRGISRFDKISESYITKKDEIHLGGFSKFGINSRQGLLNFLRLKKVTKVVDASHPFASKITESVAWACLHAKISLIRLHRKNWGSLAKTNGKSGLFWANDAYEAAEIAVRIAGEKLIAITSGRSTIPAFLTQSNKARLWARVLEPHEIDNYADIDITWRYAKGMPKLQEEIITFKTNNLGVIVSKFSGGSNAKIKAAAALNIPLVIIRQTQQKCIAKAPIVVKNVSQCISVLSSKNNV